MGIPAAIAGPFPAGSSRSDSPAGTPPSQRSPAATVPGFPPLPLWRSTFGSLQASYTVAWGGPTAGRPTPGTRQPQPVGRAPDTPSDRHVAETGTSPPPASRALISRARQMRIDPASADRRLDEDVLARPPLVTAPHLGLRWPAASFTPGYGRARLQRAKVEVPHIVSTPRTAPSVESPSSVNSTSRRGDFLHVCESEHRHQETSVVGFGGPCGNIVRANLLRIDQTERYVCMHRHPISLILQRLNAR